MVQVGTNGWMVLTSGQLTINGDIDGDGNPDITLDGSLVTDGSMGRWTEHLVEQQYYQGTDPGWVCFCSRNYPTCS